MELRGDCQIVHNAILAVANIEVRTITAHVIAGYTEMTTGSVTMALNNLERLGVIERQNGMVTRCGDREIRAQEEASNGR